MHKTTFSVQGRTVSLFPAQNPCQPLIVLNTYIDNADAVMRCLRELQCPDHSLVVVSGLDWNSDMTPWEAPPLNPKDAPFTGGAAEYLDLLCGEILPQALALTTGTPAFIGIAGYSLAGLTALYALYHCDTFSRAASMSGSLWYPQFTEYALSHPMRCTPQRIYLSLGDQEAKTKHPLLKTVQTHTETAAAHFRSLGIDTLFELNEGNHFRDAELRTAKGILAILREEI